LPGRVQAAQDILAAPGCECRHILGVLL
jgi:hypothetical protein